MVSRSIFMVTTLKDKEEIKCDQVAALVVCIQVEDWHFHYIKATTALHDRVGMLRNAAALVENSLVLLGATGIEDKLQVWTILQASFLLPVCVPVCFWNNDEVLLDILVTRVIIPSACVMQSPLFNL